jgi:hypothetical protein
MMIVEELRTGEAAVESLAWGSSQHDPGQWGEGLQPLVIGSYLTLRVLRSRPRRKS